MVSHPSLEASRCDLFVPFSRELFNASARSAVHIWIPLMSCDSSSKSPKASRASKADRADELDANIRNFAPVARIMKNALPDNAKIAKEAKECMQECVSEFISFITSEGQ